MRASPLLAASALALSACGGGDNGSNDLAIDTLTAEDLMIENSAPPDANALSEQSPAPAAAEPLSAAPRPAAPPATSQGRAPADSRAPAPPPPPKAAPPPKTAPEPEPDPHAGHDMNNMTGN